MMHKSPPPFIWAAPEERNILTWNYIIRGPPDSPYAGGEYHGVIMFPSEYPFKPPGIKMLTPSGRFQPDKKICFSMSDFHPGTWNPAWSVATICNGILSFMLSDEITTGSMTSSDHEKRLFAAKSHAWNIKQKRFQDAFPEHNTEAMRDLPNMGEADKGKPSASPSPVPSDTPPTSFPSPSSSVALHNPHPSPVAKAPPPETPKEPKTGGWIYSLLNVVRERWPYAAVLVLAVMVSRMSG